MASNHVSRVTAGGLTDATVAHSLYGYCTTAAATVAKAVTMYKTGTTAGAAWAAADLFHGLTITVRFQYSNTAASPTLNVNSTGAKPIYKYGTTVPGTTVGTSWPAQGVVQLTYDTILNSSGCWVMNDHNDDTNTNTTYSAGTGLSLSGTTFSLASHFSGEHVFDLHTEYGALVHKLTFTNGVLSFVEDFPSPLPEANTVYAAPNGSDGSPTWRKLLSADIPDLGGKYLKLTGGTLTGGLTGTAATMNSNYPYTIKHTTLDISAADNGLTSNNSRYVRFLDKDDRYYAWITGYAATNGSTRLTLSARNFGTGANVDNVLNLNVANDGTRSISVTDPIIWRNGLGIPYGTCATAAATVAKVVAAPGFTLTTGALVSVKFTVTNTGAVGSLTLNVNSTGAKAIKYRNGNLPAAGTLAANRVYQFVYDGTNYQLVGDLDTNTGTVDSPITQATIDSICV